MMNAIFSYISGACLQEIDAADYARYEDTGNNWRVREGYGALFAALGTELPVKLGVEVRAVDHGGSAISIETSHGVIEARAVILTLPTSKYETLRFTPQLASQARSSGGLASRCSGEGAFCAGGCGRVSSRRPSLCAHGRCRHGLVPFASARAPGD